MKIEHVKAVDRRTGNKWNWTWGASQVMLDRILLAEPNLKVVEVNHKPYLPRHKRLISK